MVCMYNLDFFIKGRGEGRGNPFSEYLAEIACIPDCKQLLSMPPLMLLVSVFLPSFGGRGWSQYFALSGRDSLGLHLQKNWKD